jgi:hypothetical protein
VYTPSEGTETLHSIDERPHKKVGESLGCWLLFCAVQLLPRSQIVSRGAYDASQCRRSLSGAYANY